MSRRGSKPLIRIPVGRRNSMILSAKNTLTSLSATFSMRRAAPITRQHTLVESSISPQKRLPRPNQKRLIDHIFSPDDSEKSFQTIEIRIESNWGHPSQIACGEIDFIRANGTPVKVFDTTIQGIGDKQSDLDVISNSLIESTWMEDWPPVRPFNFFLLQFTLPAEEHIETIRVWPYMGDATMNIKHVVVTSDSVILFEGDFPSDYGMIISLKYPDLIIPEELPGITDIYPSPHKITIRPLSTYGNINEYSISMIALFDSSGKQITLGNSMSASSLKSNDTDLVNKLFREIPTNEVFKRELFFVFTSIIKDE